MPMHSLGNEIYLSCISGRKLLKIVSLHLSHDYGEVDNRTVQNSNIRSAKVLPTRTTNITSGLTSPCKVPGPTEPQKIQSLEIDIIEGEIECRALIQEEGERMIRTEKRSEREPPKDVVYAFSFSFGVLFHPSSSALRLVCHTCKRCTSYCVVTPPPPYNLPSRHLSKTHMIMM